MKTQLRKVVDSNFLQRPQLRAYLAKSGRYCVILNDYTSMEAYKGDTLVSIYKSMEITEFPNQVLILKYTQTICGLSGKSAGLQRRMIDWKQTAGFAEYSRNLARAKSGHADLQKQLLRLGAEAQNHMDRLLADAAEVPDILKELECRFDDDEIYALRVGVAPSEDTLRKIVQNTMLSAALLFRDQPKVDSLPSWPDALNTFIFRFALGAHLFAMRWISVGGAVGVKPEKMRNDMVDIQFATYATFYDGLLTADSKVGALTMRCSLCCTASQRRNASKWFVPAKISF